MMWPMSMAWTEVETTTTQCSLAGGMVNLRRTSTVSGYHSHTKTTIDAGRVMVNDITGSNEKIECHP